MYSNTEEFEEFQISDPDALVSYASVTISDIHIAKTFPVYDHQGDKTVCLALIDYQDRCRLIDQRWSDKFYIRHEVMKPEGVRHEGSRVSGPPLLRAAANSSSTKEYAHFGGDGLAVSAR